MDWYDATQRQVGSRGVREVRQLLADARHSAVRDRRERTFLVGLAVSVLLAAALTIGLPTVSDATPLPPGVYSAQTPHGTVQVVVARDGSAVVEAPPILSVELALDAGGRALDTFTVDGPSGTWRVTIDVDGDGGYEADVSDVGPAVAPSTNPTASTGRGSPLDAAPGQTTDTPGRPADAPGQTSDTPGRPADAPGQTSDTPGRPADAPGQTTDTPGRSADAPGQTTDTPGRSADAPGQTTDTPGRSADAPGQAKEPDAEPGPPAAQPRPGPTRPGVVRERPGG